MRGALQGVGFLQTIKQLADELQLTGTMRNAPGWKRADGGLKEGEETCSKLWRKLSMDRFFQKCLLLCLLHTSSLVFAEVICSEAPRQDGFFLGLGTSLNSIKFEQHYSATGDANVFDETNTLVATGQAGGPAAPFSETLNTLAPVVQAGYSGCFRCTNNFWGIKCAYQYLDITSIDGPLNGEVQHR